VDALSSAVETAVSSYTRALDHPDVPLLISSVKFVINIILDILIISKFHIKTRRPIINTQAMIRMTCDLSSALTGLLYFLYISAKLQHHSIEPGNKTRPSLASLKALAVPGKWTFLESALRNAIYLWLISGIISIGSDYATAWGVFNTIRLGIFIVPVQALKASTLTFIGYA
jgi:Na+-driven multidrug efflux pump